MVSFLNLKAYTESAPVAQTVRVVVVGDQNAGKTALSELIVTKKASRPPKSTAGCAVSVALWDADDEGASSSGGSLVQTWEAAKQASQAGRGHQRFFVEIWDVSANPYYEQLRRTLYKQVNGVILVYESSDRASLRRLSKWASEVAADGSFVAPFPDETAARNIGGLPVPVLIVANKTDRQRSPAAAAAAGGALDAAISKLCGALGAAGGGGRLARVCGAVLGCRWQRGGASGGGLPVTTVAGGASVADLAELEGHIRSVRASAANGQLDWDTVGAFFTSLWARRYQPNSRQGARFVQQVPSPLAGRGGGGAPLSPAGLGPMDRRVGAGGVSGGDIDDDDRRLDDDWV